MKVLSVNAGSSSLKFKMFEMPEENVLIAGTVERIGGKGSFYRIKINGEETKTETEIKSHSDAVEILIKELFDNKIIESLDELGAVAHRLVHGGDKYPNSTVLDEESLKVVYSFKELAPLHVPANVMCVRAFMEKAPNAVQVGCFDTAFHQTIDKERFIYAVPYDWYEKYKVRRYGFHGQSHKFITETLSDMLDKKDLNAIVCHIGQGASISAIQNGKCIDTSMGFTPNAGLMMGSRSGGIDATLIPYIMKKTGKTLEEVFDDLNKKSGYLGLSGISSDSRDIEDAIQDGDERAMLSQEIYVQKIVNYIARYFVELGGCDAIVFTAGVGENSINTRATILDKLAPLGVKYNKEDNNFRGKEQEITNEESSIKAFVIPTDEELMIALDTYNLIEKKGK